MEELGDRNVVLSEELGHRDIVLLQKVGDRLVQELGDSHIVARLRQKLGDGDVVFEELGHCGVEVLAHGLVEELGHSDIIGTARSMEELGDGNIVGALVHELSYRHVIGCEELGDSGVQVIGQIHAVLELVGRHYLVQELCHSNVIISKILSDSDAILALQELGHGNVVGAEELRDNVVEELGHRDVVLVQELGK